MPPYIKAPKFRKGPEAIIQRDLIKLMTLRGWYCKETHGSAYQSGFPDLFCTHTRFGQRWVECKVATGYCFTPAQIETFPLLVANGSPVWILVEATESEYLKLFRPCNWWTFL